MHPQSQVTTKGKVMDTKEISYSRGNPADRAARAECLYKRIHTQTRELRRGMAGKCLADKIEAQRQIKRLERHCPRLKALWICFTWMAEDAAASK